MASDTGESDLTIFELRPNRLLLDPNFYGYKLSLDPLPIYTKALENGIDYAKPTSEQYSLQHVKLQVFSNHIFPDNWNNEAIYFIDSNWNILKCWIDNETERPSDPAQVCTIPGGNSKPDGRFNITLLFPTTELAVLSDGTGNLFIFSTGNRCGATETWTVKFCGDIHSVQKKNPQFVALDSLAYKVDGKSLLDVLLFRIDEKSEWTEVLTALQDMFHGTDSTFLSLLEWVTFEDVDNSWKILSSRTLLSLYSVHYGAIEENGKGIYMVVDGPCHFVQDSDSPIEIKPKPDSDPSKRKKDFVWSQTSDDVTIWFRLPIEAKKHDLSIHTVPTSLEVTYLDNPMLIGNLCHTIKADETVWTLESDRLELILSKAEKGQMWSCLIPGNDFGEQIIDPELVAQIHEQLSHLCSDKWGDDPHKNVFVSGENEECDELPADSAVFLRVDRRTQKITNQANLGTHQWLLNIRTGPNSVPCFCLRHDVDGVIWQPKLLPDKSMICEHAGTFSALGYVQASKESRKFSICSPDFSYAAICDTIKHIHVYRQPSPLENHELRNRKSGEKVSHVCKQQVIGIDPPEEIMGAYAGNEFLFVLTPKNLHAIRMRATEIM